MINILVMIFYIPFNFEELTRKFLIFEWFKLP